MRNKKGRKFSALRLILAGIIMLTLLTSCAPGAGDAVPNGNTDAPSATEAPYHGGVELYQLAPEPDSLMMSYVIVTPSRKVIVIDGGIDGRGMNEPPYLPAAIRAILGLEEGEYFEVEAWFLSHGHWDHFYELAKMLATYKESSNYRINNFYFDFPEYGVEWKTKSGDGDYNIKELEVLKKGMRKYYKLVPFAGIKGADIPEDQWAEPEDIDDKTYYYYDLINGSVINQESVKEGLTIDVDGVEFKVVCTWSKSDSNVNSTSVVLKMIYGGHTVLFLGDAANDTGNKLLRAYSDEELKCEYVQLAHHGQWGPNQKFYDRIGAPDSIRLWPTPIWVWDNAQNTYDIGNSRLWMGLPESSKDFEKQKLGNTGRDFVACKYSAYPESPSKTESWTKEVLNAQRVAIFEKAAG